MNVSEIHKNTPTSTCNKIYSQSSQVLIPSLPHLSSHPHSCLGGIFFFCFIRWDLGLGLKGSKKSRSSKSSSIRCTQRNAESNQTKHIGLVRLCN
ncbi:hypothetical protein GBA52_001345 [Prunus armeniaca]|nr:hypothetical protein GBA52_001345 [Prunus armeniaca]